MPRRIAPLGVLLIATGTLTIASAPQTRVEPLREPQASSDISSSTPFPFRRVFGGSKSDDARAIAMDSEGNVYMAGYTSSPELLSTLPLPAGMTLPPPPAPAGSPYLAKFDRQGRLVGGHLLPINGVTAATSIGLAVDDAGNVYATGGYGASAVSFAVGTYVIKFDSSGNRLFFKTFGAADGGFSQPRDMAVDTSGNIVLVAGNGSILKLNPVGERLWLRRMELGSAPWTAAQAVEVDTVGSIYVVGQTNLPTFATSGSFQPRLSPGSCVDPGSSSRNYIYIPCTDAFIAKLSPDGAVVYASFFGGAKNDYGSAVTIDNTGAATIVGVSESLDLPVVNAVQPTCVNAFGPVSVTDQYPLACGNPFIAKVDATGSRLVYATYYGRGDSLENYPAAVASDALGNTYVVGTAGRQWPTVNAVQPGYGNGPVFASQDRGASWTFSSRGLNAQASTGINSIVWPRGNVVYVADNTGLFRSDDRGSTWSELTNNGARVLGVLVDPLHPSIIYAGAWTGGWYVSLDGGRQWTPVPRPPGGCNGIVISPARTSVWYTGGAYVCRSDDGGNTWQTTFTSPELSSVRILAADPRNAATAYGAFSDRYARPTIRKTVDGGLTWNPVGPVPTFADSGPTRILIDAGDPQTIYASFAGGVIRSRDGGQTWTPINDGLPGRNEQGSSVSFEIAQDAARPQTLYAVATSEALYRTDDRGTHWQQVMAFPGAKTVAANDGRVLLVNSGGRDGFLVAFDPQGAVLTSTYLGGSREDRATVVKALAPGMVVIGGTTTSAYWPFASRSVATYQGGDDAFWIQVATPTSR